MQLFFIYQNKTIAFRHFDMNLNIMKKLDDEIFVPEHQKIWDTIKVIFVYISL